MMQKEQSTSRRSFLKTSTAAALGGALSAPLILNTKSSAASPGDTIRVGLIGCGGRGSGAAINALTGDKNAVITAVGDLYVENARSTLKNLKAKPEFTERVNVKDDDVFSGFDA